MFWKKKNTEEEPPINGEYQKMIATNKDGQPFSGKKPKERKEKRPSDFSRTMRGEKLCVTIRKSMDGPFYTTYETWMNLNEPSLIALGYRPAVNYRSGFGKTYVKFENFRKYPIMVPKDPNDPMCEERVELRTGETAYTLGDYLHSDAQQRAIDSMRAKKYTAQGSMKFLVYMVIIGIALIGGFLYMSGR